MARDGEGIRKISTYDSEERGKKYNEIISCFTCYFFLIESTQQDFVQNERSKEENQRDESLLFSSKI